MSTLSRVNKISTKSLAPDEIIIDPSRYRGSQGNDMWFFGQDGKDYLFRYSGHTSSLKAYEKCPPLTAIINQKAQAHINGKTFIMVKSGKGRGKESSTEIAIKLKKLLSKPNPLQSWKQFEAQQKIYMQLFGFCLLMPIIPVGFESFGPIEATSMWNIPPYMLTIEETNKLFYQTDISGIIKTIKLDYKGTQSDLDIKNLYLFKDFTPSFNSLIFPQSRVCSLEMPINNIIGALESRNVLINYRGALGAFTQEASSGQYVNTPMTPQQKLDLQRDFRRYGLKNDQWKFIISSASLKWQQIGIPTKDLMLIEEVDESSMMICDGYGFPPHLLGLLDPTFNNRKEAEKGLYQNTIMPEAESMYEEWNNLFKTSDYNLTIEKDYSHLPILQEDELSKASARAKKDEAFEKEFKNNVITMNRWLELLGEDTRPDGDKYYYQLLAEGYTFSSAQTIQNGNTQG